MKTFIKRLRQRKVKIGPPTVKFKNFDTNIDYTICVSSTDTVYRVKSNLVNIANLQQDSIILIHKNRVLIDDRLFSEYHVAKSDFVLFNSNIEDSLCYTYGYLDEKSYFDRVCKECVNKHKRERYNNMLINGGQIIEIEIYKVDVSVINRIKVSSTEKIFEAFERRLPDFQKCSNCKYDVLQFQRRFITENDTFDDCHVQNNDIILHYSFELLEKTRYSISAEITCLTDYFPSFMINLKCNITSLLYIISKRIGVPAQNISLFTKKKPLEILNSNETLKKLENKKINIYYKVYLFREFVKLTRMKTGSFGSVVKCYSVLKKSEVAIKKLKGICIKNEESLAHELEIYKELNHPNILNIEYFGTYLGSTMCITNFMEGGSLESYLEKYGRPSEYILKKFAKQILEGLQYLHGKQIFHMNIKESNILFDQFYNVKLSDFGLSRILFDLATKDKLNGLIQSYNRTYLYTAPEILNGEPFTSHSDIWSFGVVLVKTSKVFQPYYRVPAYEVMTQISTLRVFNYQYPVDRSNTLKSFIDSCLNSEPHDRLSIDQLLNHDFLVL